MPQPTKQGKKGGDLGRWEEGHHETEKRSVFFPLPVLGFFRDKREVDATGEARPILPGANDNGDYQALDRPPAPKRSSSNLWRFIKSHVEKETFHIQDLRTKSEIRDAKDERNFSDMRVPYEFSLLECCFALIFYLVISIVAYSFVFEKWSPIEVRIFY